ncbi:phage holin family protein [Pelagicoccus albus]|uniref:Phage holin family protein n=1 Tax=Pelagicoccus albus TaxID=415222 RepID=A0A7X1B7K4_9BACT|nr:phage holin family protein [Pelagicoccus albus]MBC2607139.1 phage holin family protein [Pelagicoccus albus]
MQTKETMNRGRSTADIPGLFGELRDEFASLFQATTALLRKELSENVSNATKALTATLTGFAVLLIGTFFAIVGLNLLVIALLAPEVMSYEHAAWVTTLTTALTMGTTGYIMAKRNARNLNAEDLIPDKTLRTLEEHGQWLLAKAEDTTK